MASAKLTSLVALTSVASADEVYCVDRSDTTDGADGTSKRITVANLIESSTLTLTNKTLTAPVIATIINTGTLTLPTSTDTLVGRDTTDTLTHKTITTPTITNPTVSTGTFTSPLFAGTPDLNGVELILDANADTSITADTNDQIDIKINNADDFRLTANKFTALSGSVIETDTINETTSGSGVTVDGLQIKDSKLATANSVDSDNYVDNSIDGEHLATNAITLGYAEIVTNQSGITTVTDITEGTVTVTVPSGGRKVKITGFLPDCGSTVAGDRVFMKIKEGATQLAHCSVTTALGSGFGDLFIAIAVVTPSAGSHTYKLTLERNTGTGTCSTGVSANPNHGFILVENA